MYIQLTTPSINITFKLNCATSMSHTILKVYFCIVWVHFYCSVSVYVGLFVCLMQCCVCVCRCKSGCLQMRRLLFSISHFSLLTPGPISDFCFIYVKKSPLYSADFFCSPKTPSSPTFTFTFLQYRHTDIFFLT